MPNEVQMPNFKAENRIQDSNKRSLKNTFSVTLLNHALNQVQGLTISGSGSPFWDAETNLS